MLPVKRDKRFGEAVEHLKHLNDLMVKDRSMSKCLVPLEGGGACPKPPIRSHTIQDQILTAIQDEDKLCTFDRGIYGILDKLISLEPNTMEAIYSRGRWVPRDVESASASTRLVACGYHDAEVFKAIERSDSHDSIHPLIAQKLTDEQHFLLAYRIVMFYMEEQNGVKRAAFGMKPQHKKDRRVITKLSQVDTGVNVANKIKSKFDERYLLRNFTSILIVFVDEIVQLPLRLAAADLYGAGATNKHGSAFVTIYPSGSELDETGRYEHRIVASWQCDNVFNTDSQDLSRRGIESLEKSKAKYLCKSRTAKSPSRAAEYRRKADKVDNRMVKGKAKDGRAAKIEDDRNNATIQRITSLVNGANTSDAGAEEFLAEFICRSRNAFFSRRDYEELLSEQARLTIEERVYCEVLRTFPVSPPDIGLPECKVSHTKGDRH